MKKMAMWVLMAGILLWAAVAPAMEMPEFYVGANGGGTKINTQSGFNEKFHFNDDDVGWKVYGGALFNKFLGVEVGYYNFGKFEENTSVISTELDDFDVVSLSLAPVVPLYKRLSLALRVGIGWWDTKLDGRVKASGAKISDDDDGSHVIFGFGPHVTINEYFSVQAGWDRLVADGDDLTMYSIGVRVSTK